MYCKYCGKELPSEAKFCFHCGQPVDPTSKAQDNAAKLRKWIIGGIAVVGVIILVAVMGGLKNYNQRNAAPTLESEQGVEVFEQVELPEQEEPVPEASEPEPEPEPEEVEVDPDSVIIPDFSDFFLKERRFDKGHGDVGRKYEMKGFPESSRDAVLEELFALLAEPQYQLELDWEDSYYYEDEGTTSYYYYYIYTGTNSDITEVYIDEANDPYTFKISVWDLWANDGVFSLGIYFNENFEEAETGKHTQQDVGEQLGGSTGSNSSGEGVSDVSGNYDHTPPASKLKCLTCDGDGDCNTCGGSGYKRIGGAKAGCTTCRGNGKCRTCKGSGTR